MKKQLVLTISTLFLGVVIVVSSSSGQTDKKKKKTNSKSTIITINDGDTIINGKHFRELSEKEKAEFRKTQQTFEKENEKLQAELKIEMENLQKEMKALNIEMANIDIEAQKMSENERKAYKIRMAKSPKAPRPPKAIREFPEPPPVPDFPSFSYSFHNERDFYIDDEETSEEGAQIFIFNDGGNKTVIKLMKATEKDLKKIGAKKEEEIKMFPNPAKDQITLNFNFSESAPVTINIYDNDGKIVKSETIKDYKAGNYEKTYSMSEFENGLYLVEFVQKDLKIFRKLSVIR